MPFLNSLGEWAAGVGTGNASWGSASGTGLVVWTPGGNTCWLDDNTLVAKHCPASSCAIKTQNIRGTAEEVTVAPRGAENISAGGGVWAAWLGGYGVFTSTELLKPASWISPRSVGPDGAIAIQRTYQANGWDVFEKDGSQWVLTEKDATDIHLLGSHRAFWVEGGEPKVVGGIPLPKPVTRPFWGLRMLETPDQGWWILYQESKQGRLVLQDEDGKGYVITTGEAFAPDFVLLQSAASADTIRVVWSTTAEENPEDVLVRDINVDSEFRIDLQNLSDTVVTEVPLPPGTVTISTVGVFNVAGLADEQVEFPPDIFPAYPHESGRGRLFHPTLGIYDYEVKPDEWVNIDADAIIPPVWSSTRTLTSAANVLWNGHLRDVVVEERWKALGGLSMPMTQLRTLVDMWMRSLNPETEYVKWYPNYITRVSFKVILLSVHTGGQGLQFDDVVNYKDENGDEIGWMTAPVTLVMRLVERL